MSWYKLILAKKEFVSYDDAKKIVRENGIQNYREYLKWVKQWNSTHSKSLLPTNPDKTYRNEYSYVDFFGKVRPSSRNLDTNTNVEEKQL